MAKKVKRVAKAKVAPAQEAANFVGKEEFNKFKEQQDQSMAAILDAVKNIGQSAPVQPEQRRVYAVTTEQESVPTPIVEQASAKSSNYTLNPAYQAIFEEYFDPADGFEARLEYPNFTIIVPMKFSNADEAWKKFYKVDTRLKFLKHDNIEGGMRDWCKLVAANLKYNKNLKTK